MTKSAPKTAEKAARIVTVDEAGLRLDRWFRRHFPALSHGALQKLLRTGQIRVAGRRADSSRRLEAGEPIRLPPQLQKMEGKGASEGRLIRPVRNLRDLILYEDDDVIALNKPAGLAVQGGTGLKQNLDDSLMALSRDGKTKPKLVHRLDRDTSGVLLIARTDFAAAKLTAAFRERSTKKIYWAVTAGVPNPLAGRLDAPLLKAGELMVVAEQPENKQGVMPAKAGIHLNATMDPRLRGDDAQVSLADPSIKSAATLYRVIDSVPKKAAFVALWPLTGRTHQLRVHMTYLGAPILGDRLYGGEPKTSLPLNELGKGLHLHARRLIIPHPRRGLLDVTAPLSPAMAKTFRWFQFDDGEGEDFTSFRGRIDK